MDRIPGWVDGWFAATAIVIAALIVIDFLMGPTARRALRDRVGYWWLVLDDISLEGIYQSVTRWTLARLQHIGGRRLLSIRFFASSCLIFGCITIVAIAAFVSIRISAGEYFFLSVHEPVPIPASAQPGPIEVDIPMQLDRYAQLGPWQAVRCLSVAFILPNVLVGTLSLILTRLLFQIVSKSRRFHMIAVLTMSNIVLSLALVTIPYFVGFLVYRVQFFDAVAHRVIYHVPGSRGPKAIWAELPPKFAGLSNWSFLQYDFENTMLRLLYQEPLVREMTQLVVSHDDGGASLIVVMEPEHGYRPLNFFSGRDIAVEGGFTQVFQIRTMAYLMFVLISALSVLPVLINVIFAAVLGVLRAAESVLRPASAFLLRRLYEDGRPVLSIAAVIAGAIFKAVQELIKQFF